jgi:hypothetical protein
MGKTEMAKNEESDARSGKQKITKSVNEARGLCFVETHVYFS